MRNLKNILIILIIIGIIVGCYLYFAKHKATESDLSNISESNNNQKYTFGRFELFIDYDKMEHLPNCIYYKKIYSYAEYLSFNPSTPNILEISEDDFENQFMVIIAIENESLMGLALSQVYQKDDTLCIALERKSENIGFTSERNAMYIMVDNSLKSSNINIFDIGPNNN